MKFLIRYIILIPILFSAGCGVKTPGHGINHAMSLLVLQLAIIIFAARFTGMLFRRMRLPPVIGELCAGILIGPYMLGSISFPGFSGGLFPLPADFVIPVSAELYALAVIASILLLFGTGLETDIAMLSKFSLAGLAVGLGGALVSFIAGATVTSWILNRPFLAPACLFMGAVCTATSIGIVTRVLHDTKKVESPEGALILAGAFFDDVIGIILLALIIGTAAVSAAQPESASIRHQIALIVGRSLLVWMGFTAIGLFSARYIGAFLKRFKSITVFSTMAFGIGLLAAGIFERAGLAMIIGAYTAGLALSKTDIRYVTAERLKPINAFLVPVFFVVMGMFVNPRHIVSGTSFLFGALFTLAAIAAKMGGCGLPALFFGFNRLGAARIGTGMAPRSEVALIIAGIGMTSGILNNEMFAATATMVLFSALTAPALLERLMKNPASGMRIPMKAGEKITIKYDFPSTDIADFVVMKTLDYFSSEGFFVHSMPSSAGAYYRLNRDNVYASLTNRDGTITLETARKSVILIKTLVYEALLNVHDSIGRMKHLTKPESMRREITEGDRESAEIVSDMIRRSCLRAALESDNKRGIIEELIGILDGAGFIKDRAAATQDVLDREQAMSTGMQCGIALPHAKTTGVVKMCVAVGLKKEGLDFQSLDGLPSRIFIMVLSPKNISGPHIQFLAGISSMFSSKETREKLIACNTDDDMFMFFREKR